LPSPASLRFAGSLPAFPSSQWRLGRCLSLDWRGPVLQLQAAYDLRIPTPDDDRRLARLCRGAWGYARAL